MEQMEWWKKMEIWIIPKTVWLVCSTCLIDMLYLHLFRLGTTRWKLFAPPNAVQDTATTKAGSNDSQTPPEPSTFQKPWEDMGWNWLTFSRKYTWYSSWWFQPIWKILVKLDHLPQGLGENQKCLKPPPSYLSGCSPHLVTVEKRWWK